MGTDRLITKMFDAQGMNVTNANGSKKSKMEPKEAFFSYLNQGQINDGTMSFSEKKTDIVPTYEGSKESYDRYQYKMSNIQSDGARRDEQLELSESDKEVFEKDIVGAVCEQLDVSEEKVVEAMQMLGVTVYDMLNPQVLADVTVELLDVQDASALLLDARFQTLLTDVAACGNELMGRLQIDVEQMKELLSQMEVVEEPESIDLSEIAMDIEYDLNFEKAAVETGEIELVGADESGVRIEKQVSETEKTVIMEKDAEQSVQQLDGYIEKEPVSSQKNDGFGQSGQEEHELPEQSILDKKADSNEATEKSVGFDLEDVTSKDTHLHMGQAGTVENQNTVVNETPITENTSSYVSVDTVQIIEQIVERVRVSHVVDAPTIEMQLNPENLGKMYVNISSKQGVINAQIAATNDSVKEALEAQIVELKETLNQAGVKVDAIEVTIASHEFERNLEQGQSREEQEAERQEELKNHNRRSLDASSVEELAGVMSEEETLIAQIMRDNGNSVDYMA